MLNIDVCRSCYCSRGLRWDGIEEYIKQGKMHCEVDHIARDDIVPLDGDIPDYCFYKLEQVVFNETV